MAECVSVTEWALVFQSRNGRLEAPWLDPDISSYRHAEWVQGHSAAVISPIGFVCDHIEVLWDLDVEATAACREVGVEAVGAEAVGADPVLIGMIADVVPWTVLRAKRGSPLFIVSPSKPVEATESPGVGSGSGVVAARRPPS